MKLILASLLVISILTIGVSQIEIFGDSHNVPKTEDPPEEISEGGSDAPPTELAVKTEPDYDDQLIEDNSELDNLKKENLELKLENRQLKNKINELEETITQLYQDIQKLNEDFYETISAQLQWFRTQLEN